MRVLPIIYGGGQQKGMRSGTENVPAIAGLGKAAEEFYSGHEEKIERLYLRKKQMVGLLCGMEGVFVHALSGQVEDGAPHIVSAGFEGVRSEVLLHALEERGVYVSSGSACSTNHPGISTSLEAIGVRKELLDSTLRFSFSPDTTAEEVDYAAAQIRLLLPVLRRYTAH